MFSRSAYEKARDVVYETLTPTLQYAWPLISRAAGCETWVKHENHTPIGAFKVRGGLVHMRNRANAGLTNGVITATRGNHGQSIPFAAAREGIAATIVVPRGNSVEKNEAMRALGADLVEEGADFDEAARAARRLADERGLDILPSFHADLVMGVSTYAHELFDAAGELDAVYAPIGMGSGLCGVISARNMLGLKTRVIGVVAENASVYQKSFEAGRALETDTASTFADGMAVRCAHPEAVDYINKGADHIVAVSEEEIANAIRLYFSTIHTVAEGAGAASLAALFKEREKMKGKRVGVILSGGNIDTEKFQAILAGQTPAP
ncbi:MAG TPA: threonine dehydratase [Rhizobiales bacterium]|nr:threonine dehydratase [Hyphomicrobiales bacterium]